MARRYENAEESIRVTMFGGFRLEDGGAGICDSDARTHQLWHLLEYLITFRHKVVSQDELIEILWHDNEIDNPSNALKNLVYRLRSLFAAHNLPHAKDLIIFSGGCYQWNNKLKTYVDIEEFEERCRLARDLGRSDPDKYMEAIDVYQGDFLPGSCYEDWVVPLVSHYRLMYFQCVYHVLSILAEQQRYAEMETVCKKALAIDKFEEEAHKYFILSLIKQGKRQLALEHYGFVTDLFFRELGVTPSESMRALYREIIKTTHDVEVDIGIIKEELRETDEAVGAFYCEYEVFKNLYRLEARTAARTGQAVFISLLTAVNSSGNPLDVKTLSKAMDALYGTIKTSLRKGDVFSRFSATQYVLMIPSLTYENCVMVMERIIKKYRQAYRSKDVDVLAKVQPLNPVELSKSAN